MNQLGYLWAVAGVVWLGTLVYVMTILRRQSRLAKELTALERRLAEWDKRPS